MKLINWRGIGGILLVLAMLLVNSYWAAPVKAQSPAQSISKVGNLLATRIKIKTELTAQTAAPALSDASKSDLKASGELNNTNSEKIYIYFSQQPSTAQINELRSLGVTVYPESWIPPVGNHPNGFVLAEMPVDKLDSLAARSYVTALDTAENEFQYQNDVARTTMGVGDVWTGGDTGTGVTVAVLDSGIDTSNADFPTINSSNSADYGNYPTIDYTVNNTVTGHGTHVAGSVLGRGVNSATYRGMAPGASLVFLKIGDDDGKITSSAVVGALHAAVDTYHAKIINMSIGGWNQYHDGSEAEDQAVDYATAQGAAVFIAAGNSGGSGWHYSGSVGANTTTGYIPLVVNQGSTSALSNNLVWYVGNGANTSLNLQYFNSSLAQLSPTTTGASLSTRGTKSNSYYFSTQQSAGTYYFRVQNTSSTSQFFHIFYNGGSSAVAFTSPDQSYTLDSPSEADSAISVGAYVSRTTWTDYTGQQTNDSTQTLGTISTTSSRGPRVDTGAPPKPDIVAPGRFIISVRDTTVYTFPTINTGSDLGNYAFRVIDNDGLGLGPGNTGPANYLAMSGTSMASPVAAGVGALLLSKNPSLTPAQVKQILQSSATDKGTAGVDNIYGYGLVNASAAINGSSPPAAPSLTSPADGANVSGTSVTFQWSASSGATNYWLVVRKSSDNSVLINKGVGNVTTDTESGFPNDGTAFTWVVAAGNGAGWSSASTARSFTNGATVTIPAAPSLTSPADGANVSGTSVTFQWAASSGATNYWLVVQKVSDNSVLINKAVGNVTSDAESGFPNDGTQYRWLVAAGNSAGWSSASTARTFTNGSVVTIPSAPSLTSPTDGATVSGTSVTFQWNASSGATNYWLVVQKVSDNSILINKAVGNVTSSVESGFPNDGTQYRWLAAAGNSAGWGSASATRTFTNGTAVTIPSAPSLTSPVDGATVSGTSVTFQWAASSGATNYWLVVQKVSDNSVLINKAVGNVTTDAESGFPNDGTQYRWLAAAGNSAGWGSASTARTFTNGTAVTIPPAPSLTSPAEGATVTGTSVTFQWAASSGATNYWLAVLKASDNSVLINKAVGNVTSDVESGFPNNGTQYRWVVAAGNSAGWGSASTARTFTSGTAVTIPSAPSLTSPADGATVSGTSVTFQWAASSGATNYWLAVVKVSDNSVLINKAVGNVTSDSEAGFPNNGTQYRWVVAAGNSAGWGSASTARAFTNGP
jgi:subtilisin family serine protease